jgi:hypothetical protein
MIAPKAVITADSQAADVRILLQPRVPRIGENQTGTHALSAARSQVTESRATNSMCDMLSRWQRIEAKPHAYSNTGGKRLGGGVGC